MATLVDANTFASQAVESWDDTLQQLQCLQLPYSLLLHSSLWSCYCSCLIWLSQ